MYATAAADGMTYKIQNDRQILPEAKCEPCKHTDDILKSITELRSRVFMKDFAWLEWWKMKKIRNQMDNPSDELHTLHTYNPLKNGLMEFEDSFEPPIQ